MAGHQPHDHLTGLHRLVTLCQQVQKIRPEYPPVADSVSPIEVSRARGSGCSASCWPGVFVHRRRGYPAAGGEQPYYTVRPAYLRALCRLGGG